MFLDGAPANAQDRWRWCQRCHGAYFIGNGDGRCPAGGQHDNTGSYHYIVVTSSDQGSFAP